MTSIDHLYRERIGLPKGERLTFEMLDTILEKTAQQIPFENLRIMNKQPRPITKQNLAEKILHNNEGGVCYEINTLLYHFLLENNFHVELARGRTFNFDSQVWSKAGRTHIISLLSYQGEKYVIDSGFGGNLPLKAVPLCGKVVTSKNGNFRIRKINHEDGDYILELKLKYRDQDWVRGYVFRSTHQVTEESELNEVQQLIVESAYSPFNKSPLVTRQTDNGNIILTKTSFTERINERVVRREIVKGEFNDLLYQHFGIR